MRSAAWLLGGMTLVVVGIGLIAGEVPGRWVIGPLLVVAGLAVKCVAFLADPPDGGSRAGERPSTTLGGQQVERPRAGIPAGRASMHRHRATRPGAPPRPTPPRPAPAVQAPAVPNPLQRRAS